MIWLLTPLVAIGALILASLMAEFIEDILGVFFLGLFLLASWRIALWILS